MENIYHISETFLPDNIYMYTAMQTLPTPTKLGIYLNNQILYGTTLRE